MPSSKKEFPTGSHLKNPAETNNYTIFINHNSLSIVKPIEETKTGCPFLSLTLFFFHSLVNCVLLFPATMAPASATVIAPTPPPAATVVSSHYEKKNETCAEYL